jgi:ribonuclease-3
MSSNQRYKEFVVAVVVNGEEVIQGKGETKKKAEQEASKNACEKLQIAR